RTDALSVPGHEGAVRYPLGTHAARCAAETALRRHMDQTPEGTRPTTLAGFLDQLGVSASGFPHDDERFQPLTRAAIRKMADAGIEFGSHTVSHPMMAHLTDAQRAVELLESKRVIEEMTGHPCDSFCYPYGWPVTFDASTRAQVRAAGYRCALTA